MALQTLTLPNEGKSPKSLTEIDEDETLDVELAEDDFDDEDNFDEVEEEDNEDEFEDVEDTEGDSDDLESDEDLESEETDDEDDDEDEEEQQKQVNSRANDRIRSLVEAQKVKEGLLAKQKQENKQLRQQMASLQKTTKESSISLLNNHLEAIKDQMAKAQEEGETTKFIDLQEKLNKTQMDIAALDSWEPEEIPEDSEEDTTPAPRTLEEAPAATQEWLTQNPWFQNPKTPEDITRQKEAIAYSQILSSDGYSTESEDYYNMIDERLDMLGLAKETKNKVKSKKTTKKTSSARRKTKKKVSQTVQGASRSSRSNSKSRNKITLTKEQQNIADLYGMSYPEYARELLKIEKAEQKGKRMTQLDLDA